MPTSAQRIVNASSTFDDGAMRDLDLGHLPARVSQAIWRGTDIGQASETVMSSGYAALDAELPGRGWPSDGTLNYAPLIVGRNTLERGQGRIGARWVADLVWSPRIWRESGGASFRAERKLGLAQYWLGWDQAAQQAGGLTWRLEIEPTIRAASFTASWRNWEGALATDGQGAGSELSQLRLAWRSRF